MKDKRIVVLAGLLAFYFVLNGVVKLASHPHVVGNFDAWGTRARSCTPSGWSSWRRAGRWSSAGRRAPGRPCCWP